MVIFSVLHTEEQVQTCCQLTFLMPLCFDNNHGLQMPDQPTEVETISMLVFGGQITRMFKHIIRERERINI